MKACLLATVVAQESLSDRLWIVTLLLHETAGFLPGQYQAIHTTSGRILGPFSISSTPAELPKIVFCLRHRLDLLIGEEVTLTPPKGDLVFSDLDKHYVLCAGGTGITPFISLMNAHPLQKLTCFWSIKDKEDLVLVDHFKIKQSIKIHYYQKDDTQDLQNYLSELGLRDNLVYYLAGPFPFIQAHGDWLLQQGVSPCNLFSDMKKFVN